MLRFLGPALSAVVLAAPALAASVRLRAQAPSRGAFVVMLGRDTLAVEQYTRGADRLEGDLLTRVPRTAIAHYVVSLAPDGTPRTMTVTMLRADGTPVPNGPRAATATFSRDSVITVVTADTAITVRSAAPNAFPLLQSSFALYELWLARARATRADTGIANLLGAGARSATPYGYRFLGADSVRVWYFGAPQYLRVDAAGRIQSVDATQTAGKVTATRVAAVDIPSLAAHFAALDAAGQGFGGAASPRDTARAIVGGATLSVDYGRPALRGRDVWAHGVLGDSIWRTGANAATQLSTSRDLVMNGTTVPAGTYTLWTRAAPDGSYELIVNRQTGQWGTEYHADRNLVRVPLAASSVATPLERFTVTIVPNGNQAGTIQLAWGTRLLAAPFTVK